MAGQDQKSVSLSLEAPYQAVFADDTLPMALTLGDFTDLHIVQSIRVLGFAPDGMSQIDEGQLTSLVKVPEPTSVVLMLMATILLGLNRPRG
jgi:hypothetical protein